MPRLKAVYTYGEAGVIEISETQQVQFNAVNDKGDAIEGLEFYAHNIQPLTTNRSLTESSQLPSMSHQVRLSSTFDTESGKYYLDLPKHQTLDVFVKLDTDSDGIADFTVDSASHEYSLWDQETDSNRYSYFNPEELPLNTARFSLRNSSQVELSLQPTQEIELRFSIQQSTNEHLKTLSGASIHGQAVDSRTPVSQFDEELQQHIIKLPRKSTTRLSLPAFHQDGLSFSSQLYSLTIENDVITLTKDVGDYGSITRQTLLERPLSEIIDIALVLEPYIPSKPENRILSSGIVAPNNSIEVYYSQPVSVFDEQSITLEKLVPQITRDNEYRDSVNFDIIEQSIESSHQIDLNNTRLTITPENNLTEGFYHYDIANLETQEQGQFAAQIENISGDNGHFYFSEDTSFSMSDIVADNLTSANSGNHVRLLLPMSIQSLSDLTIQIISYIEDGENNSYNSTLQIVEDGAIIEYNASLSYTVSIADNEWINNNTDYSSPFRPNTLEDSSLTEGQFVYNAYYLGPYLADNTNESENSVTLQYNYTTKTGETKSGTVTLPIQ